MDQLPTGLPSLATLSTWRDNFVRNTSEAFTKMQARDYIRLVVIIGAYALLRPYIMKIGARLQERQHERDAMEELLPADIHPNELRTGKKFAIPGVEESDSEEEGEAKPGQWGKRARVRQRKFIREKLEEEERRLREAQEEEEDKDIADLLED
ncbi:DUF1531-domain-containing protein [Lentithecium fluviatile CBS 122367]|uniref:DUF1531-domain-containing protein n=1 Tax=Lentithecium fluviatile CBS 122367 TaxID=1168545 RepID=A0A6G1JG49_9PLEO|nr:DUF1531-domain-containing protein [Lentithecium fluviatile CBS 122367]